ncbi:flagellar biosynthesis protein FlhF [Paraburkholderia sp. J41]|uniref:flagellar biosynthesis protein FlhF n=1 Tax=Paraburkholderia sp. J41 TaxID=2805433 RepID=UPI002AC33727|nr:flagellar biosynthesis protein FlhF [Paraburkholderia sp. J41]
MNIRKFIGGTSRDALRLVREALGADAVVLSNRTLDDGNVEIVALADRDLAAIAPAGEGAAQGQGGFAGFGSGASGGFGAQAGQGNANAFAQPAAALPRPPRAVAAAPIATAAAAALGGGANPYANGGMPDVFSSVFGASPEVGAEHDGTHADADADSDASADTSVTLGREAAAPASSANAPLASASRAAAGQHAAQSPMPATLQSTLQSTAQSTAQSAGHAAAQSTLQSTLQSAFGSNGNAPVNAAQPLSPSMPQSNPQPASQAASQSGAPAGNAANAAANLFGAHEAAALIEQAAKKFEARRDPQFDAPFDLQGASAPRTMAETNPWLIDHARRIANQQDAAREAGMTPSAARAKGLGSVADPVLPAGVEATQPEWAREAAYVAARRAAQSIGQSADAAGPAPTRREDGEKGEKGEKAAGKPGAQSTAATVSEAIRARIEQVVNETVMSELASMRGMMEEQFAGLLWGERQRRSPMQGALTKQLFAAGFSAQLVKMMIDRLPEVETEEAGMAWLQSVLESNLPVLEDEETLMERGGVFALMGPTGVGKTTTTAKLAARCVMRFGASKVALLTTDSYRIGGHEQLRIFGKILGVSVHAVRDGADLQLALAELKNKHIVLIDTIGMSQRDRAVADQIAMLCGAGRPVRRILLLSATSHGDTLNEVVQAYQSDDAPLTGCILTKLDEATNLGCALDTVLRYKLPVHYVSTGQKVPENLYVATRRFLIRSAFCIPRDRSPFVPHEDDIPALLSALSTRSNSQAPEVRFG